MEMKMKEVPMSQEMMKKMNLRKMNQYLKSGDKHRVNPIGKLLNKVHALQVKVMQAGIKNQRPKKIRNNPKEEQKEKRLRKQGIISGTLMKTQPLCTTPGLPLF